MKRKGLFFILILLIVGAVLAVVFMGFFAKKDTEDLAIALNSATTNGYLAKEKADEDDLCEYKVIQEYFKSAKDNVTGSDSVEIANYIKVYDSYIEVAQFFNRELPFLTFTKFYKDNRSDVKRSLTKAQNSATEIVEYVEKTKGAVGGVSYWEVKVWQEIRGEVLSFLKSTSNALKLCAEIYQNSVTSKILNNDLTDVVFIGLNDYVDQVEKESATNTSLGEDFLQFTKNCFSKDTESNLLKYEYCSTNWKKTVEDIKAKGKKSTYYNLLLTGEIVSSLV